MSITRSANFTPLCMQPYVEAWAANLPCGDKCAVEVEAAIEEIGGILLNAVVAADESICVGGFSRTHMCSFCFLCIDQQCTVHEKKKFWVSFLTTVMGRIQKL